MEETQDNYLELPTDISLEEFLAQVEESHSIGRYKKRVFTNKKGHWKETLTRPNIAMRIQHIPEVREKFDSLVKKARLVKYGVEF